MAHDPSEHVHPRVWGQIAVTAACMLLGPANALAQETLAQVGTPVEIGLSPQQREAVARIVQARLADEFRLYALTWMYHWNVDGIEFAQLHELFGKQYEALAEMVDAVAERVQQLGYEASVSADSSRSGVPRSSARSDAVG